MKAGWLRARPYTEKKAENKAENKVGNRAIYMTVAELAGLFSLHFPFFLFSVFRF